MCPWQLCSYTELLVASQERQRSNSAVVTKGTENHSQRLAPQTLPRPCASNDPFQKRGFEGICGFQTLKDLQVFVEPVQMWLRSNKPLPRYKGVKRCEFLAPNPGRQSKDQDFHIFKRKELKNTEKHDSRIMYIVSIG